MSDAPITIPADLLPADGRFGSGPSKVRPAQVEALAAIGRTVLGTSHRQAPVKNLVKAVREGLATFFDLPDGYEVVLGNGGSTAFWDIAAFGLVRDRAQHLSFGEFSSKFASVTRKAPFLGEPTVITSEPGTRPDPRAEAGVDVYAWAHNETSTGVMCPVRRVEGADDDALSSSTPPPAPVACRSTSPRPTSTTSPRRSPSPPTAACGSASSPPPRSPASRRSPPAGAGCPTSSACRPRSTTRARTRRTTPRPWRPSRCSRTRWSGSTATAASTGPPPGPPTPRAACTGGPRRTDYATPYVPNPANRSQVVATIDFDESVDAAAVARTLRANGVVDVEPYRKLGRNQLRVACFPAVEPDDVSRLIASVEYVVDRLS